MGLTFYTAQPRLLCKHIKAFLAESCSFGITIDFKKYFNALNAFYIKDYLRLYISHKGFECVNFTSGNTAKQAYGISIVRPLAGRQAPDNSVGIGKQMQGRSLPVICSSPWQDEQQHGCVKLLYSFAKASLQRFASVKKICLMGQPCADTCLKRCRKTGLAKWIFKILGGTMDIQFDIAVAGAGTAGTVAARLPNPSGGKIVTPAMKHAAIHNKHAAGAQWCAYKNSFHNSSANANMLR